MDGIFYSDYRGKWDVYYQSEWYAECETYEQAEEMYFNLVADYDSDSCDED